MSVGLAARKVLLCTQFPRNGVSILFDEADYAKKILVTTKSLVLLAKEVWNITARHLLIEVEKGAKTLASLPPWAVVILAAPLASFFFLLADVTQLPVPERLTELLELPYRGLLEWECHFADRDCSMVLSDEGLGFASPTYIESCAREGPALVVGLVRNCASIRMQRNPRLGLFIGERLKQGSTPPFCVGALRGTM